MVCLLALTIYWGGAHSLVNNFLAFIGFFYDHTILTYSTFYLFYFLRMVTCF